MMSEHEILTVSFTIKLSQESFMTKQKNRMKIISTIMKQKQFMTLKTQQLILNDLL